LTTTGAKKICAFDIKQQQKRATAAGDVEGRSVGYKRCRAELFSRTTRDTTHEKTAASVAIQVPLETEATATATATEVAVVTGCPKIEEAAAARLLLG